MNNRNYSAYYGEMLGHGLQYQDFVVDQLYKCGLPIVSYSSKKYQCLVGENKPGFEIKFDRRFRDTGNFYIETAEKSNPNRSEFVKSGIYRDDNTWLYIIGDYEDIFIFSKKQLKTLHEHGNLHIKKRQIATSQGFTMPVEYAKKFLLIKHIAPEIKEST